jgi:hypothetical protein
VRALAAAPLHAATKSPPVTRFAHLAGANAAAAACAPSVLLETPGTVLPTPTIKPMSTIRAESPVGGVGDSGVRSVKVVQEAVTKSVGFHLWALPEQLAGQSEGKA